MQHSGIPQAVHASRHLKRGNRMKTPNFQTFRKRSWAVWCAVAIILLLLAGAVLFVWKVSVNMFAENPRFTLTEVRINGNRNGFWTDKKEQICSMLQLRPGLINLFSLEPSVMRAKLLREPSIESATVTRILPDTLEIGIVERIPIALINSPRSRYVTDAACILMQKGRCMNIDYSLPIIIGLRNEQNFVPGMKASALKGAVDLIELTRTRWPEIRVASVSITQADTLICAIYYKNRIGTDEIYRVVMPDSNIETSLKRLLQVLEHILETRNKARYINLNYKGQAVLTMPAES